jgi:hypothetical protein
LVISFNRIAFVPVRELLSRRLRADEDFYSCLKTTAGFVRTALLAGMAAAARATSVSARGAVMNDTGSKGCTTYWMKGLGIEIESSHSMP